MAHERFPTRAAHFLTDIEIIEVGSSDWHLRVLEALNAGIQPRLSSKAINGILQLVENELHCKTVVIEPYHSTDFADEYSSFYSRLFQDVPRVCKRLHFFRGIGTEARALDKSDVLNLTAEITSAYRGYSVVRPTSPMRVGDTVLASPFDHDGLDLVHCQTVYEAHLLGHPLCVRGMPFIEQDSAVGVCADSDLWMLARYMHMTGECRRFRPSEMRKLATRSVFHGQVREGLIREQMMDALRQMDLSPEVVFATSADEMLALLYSCVESEIPVIVGIPGHVVTVIGHGYAPVMQFAATTDATSSMAQFVTSFIAHDDAQRPYREMPIARVPAPPDLGFSELLTLDGNLVHWCIFPEPPRVNLRRSDILALLSQWLPMIVNLKDWLTVGPSQKWWTHDDLKGLVTREYLRRSDKFKRDLYPNETDERWNDPKFASRPIELVLRYWCQRMPRYVWVIELARRADLAGKAPHERRIVGEIVFDATAHHDDIWGALLAFHLDDHLLLRNPPGSVRAFESFDMSLHQAYSPLLRGFGAAAN